MENNKQPTEPATEKEPDGYLVGESQEFIPTNAMVGGMWKNATPVYLSPVSQTKDTKELRDKFFDECCKEHAEESGVKFINVSPENVFEWFMSHLFPVSQTTEEKLKSIISDKPSNWYEKALERKVKKLEAELSQTKDTKEQKRKEISLLKIKNILEKASTKHDTYSAIYNQDFMKIAQELRTLFSSHSQQPTDKWDKINKAFDSVSDEEFKECINNRKLQQPDSSQTKGLDITDEEKLLNLFRDFFTFHNESNRGYKGIDEMFYKWYHNYMITQSKQEGKQK